MSRAVVLTLAGLLVAGCGKKNAGPEAAAESSDGPTITAQIPNTKDARSYAKKLVATQVTDWEPVSGSATAKFVYSQLDFLPSGRFAANAYLEASFEKINCKEAGTWTIKETEGDRSATMVWTLDKTDCPTREAGSELRVQMILAADGYKINFR